MSLTVAASTQINLSSKSINSTVLGVAGTAQILGLSLNEATANLSKHSVEFRQLAALYNQFESLGLPPISEQCWK